MRLGDGRAGHRKGSLDMSGKSAGESGPSLGSPGSSPNFKQSREHSMRPVLLQVGPQLSSDMTLGELWLRTIRGRDSENFPASYISGKNGAS